MDSSKKIFVFYHGYCRDGFTAAWAAWKKLGDIVEYVPVIWTNQSEKVPDLKNKEIYFLDYCPVREKVNQLQACGNKITIIDHHASREDITKSVPGSVFDNNHSGAVLAWQYFHPDKPVPWLCCYAEDSDIWKWSIPGSRSVLNYLDFKLGKEGGTAHDFLLWDKMAVSLEDPLLRKVFEERGSILVEYRKQLINFIVESQAQVVEFEGYEVYAVNAPRNLRSEMGMVLSERKPPFAIVWSQTPEDISISLRSIKDFDLIPLAEKYGGGGHKNASNFRLSLDAKLPWKVINKK